MRTFSYMDKHYDRHNEGVCVAPATGSKETVRNEAGQIVSVPGFVTK